MMFHLSLKEAWSEVIRTSGYIQRVRTSHLVEWRYCAFFQPFLAESNSVGVLNQSSYDIELNKCKKKIDPWSAQQVLLVGMLLEAGKSLLCITSVQKASLVSLSGGYTG
jgi:hypothetical protein